MIHLDMAAISTWLWEERMSSDSIEDFDDDLVAEELAAYNLAARVSAANGPAPSVQLWS